MRWLGDGEADALEPLAPAKTETLSAYELALHGSYNFSAGDEAVIYVYVDSFADFTVQFHHCTTA